MQNYFSRGEPWTMAPLNEPDPNKRDISYLDQYAQERWDTVLHYLVGSSQQSGVSLDAVKILLHSGLMTTDSSDSSTHHITKAGFQFLLMETSSQVRKDFIFFFGLNIGFPNGPVVRHGNFFYLTTTAHSEIVFL